MWSNISSQRCKSVSGAMCELTAGASHPNTYSDMHSHTGAPSPRWSNLSTVTPLFPALMPAKWWVDTVQLSDLCDIKTLKTGIRYPGTYGGKKAFVEMNERKNENKRLQKKLLLEVWASQRSAATSFNSTGILGVKVSSNRLLLWRTL